MNNVDLSKLITLSAREMSKGLRYDFEGSRSLVCLFLNSHTPNDFYNLNVDKKNMVTSKQIKNILIKKGSVTFLDFAEAVAYVSSSAVAAGKDEFVISCITSGIWFVRTIKNACTIKFDERHSALILAIHRNEGKSKKKVMKALADLMTNLAFEKNEGRDSFDQHIQELLSLGAIEDDGKGWKLSQTITFV